MKPAYMSARIVKVASVSLLLLLSGRYELTAQTSWQIGSGTTFNDQYTYPTPYGNWYSGMRTQFLYTAAECAAAGMTPGTIDQLAFNVVATNGTQPLQSYNIYIKGTTTPNTNTFQTTGFTLVYSNPSLSPSLGWNTYTLSSPFSWNGTDNILIDICFWDGPSNYTYNASTQWTQNVVPGVNTSIWYRSDAGGPFCTTTSVTGTSTTRPNIQFTRLLGPPDSLVANPANICSGSQTTLSADGLANGATANWSGPGIPANTSTAAVAGTATYTFTPPAVTNTTVYTYNVSQTVGATTSQSTSGTLTVDPLPVFAANSPNSNSPVCEGSTLTLNVQTTPAGSAYSWTGPGLGSPATTATVNIPYAAPSDAGTYTVTVTTAAGCSATGTTTAVINPKPVDTLLPLTPVCSADPAVVLTGGSPAGGIYYGTGVSSGMFDPTQGTQTISYAYTDGNGCMDTSSQVQTVLPSPSVIIATLPELCSNSAALTLYGGVPQGGTFSGPNVVNGVFTQTGSGVYPITYTATVAGCTGSTTQDLIVHAAGATGLAGATNTTETQFTTDVPATTEVRYIPDCDLMAIVSPTGASPIVGNMVVKVTLDENVSMYNNRPYAQRHYNVESVGFANTATATITLFAYQSEFDAYNTVASTLGLPLLPTGATDNGNVRITQFHGLANTPDEYLGAVLITPTVSWDATNNWWVMTFPVTGMSGFYIHTGVLALDVANVSTGLNGAMEVYPNPSKDKITVNISGNISKNGQLSVSDLTGRILIRVPMDNDKAVIDMSSLAAGMYMVNYSDDERKETVKITKQ